MADATETKVVPTPDELLQREAAGRTLAGLAALGSALAITFAFMLQSAITGNAPSVTITTALQDAAGKGDPKSGLLTEWITYQHDKVGLIALQALLQILGTVGFALILLYLFNAAKGRRPEVPAWVRWLLIVGATVAIVGTLLVTIGDAFAFKDFVNSADHSTSAGHDAVHNAIGSVGGPLLDIGKLAVIVGWVLVSLNAMRVGLLTRFLGFLGILGGILTFVLYQLPIIQIFWLVVVGMTVLQRYTATPPAWKTGRPEPWPTQQEAREARERAAQSKSKPAAKTKPAEPAADGIPSPATSSRKRKRRS